MPRWAHNKMPVSVKRRYFELVRSGLKGAEAARRVGVSTSCGSLWFIDAGSVIIPEPRPISSRFLTQDDRIVIADGLAARVPVKEIAAGIGKSFQTVYREIARGCSEHNCGSTVRHLEPGSRAAAGRRSEPLTPAHPNRPRPNNRPGPGTSRGLNALRAQGGVVISLSEP
jgi:Helix-turn-helix domain